jgi:hypothetical protein
MPFCSVLRKVWRLCDLSCTMTSIPMEQMYVYCSRGGHRRADRQISWDGVVIVGGKEVAVLPAGVVGIKGAKVKGGHSH